MYSIKGKLQDVLAENESFGKNADFDSKASGATAWCDSHKAEEKIQQGLLARRKIDVFFFAKANC